MGSFVIQSDLVKEGYGVKSIATIEDRIDKRTVIVFDKEVQEEAVELSRELGGALLSAKTGSSTSLLPNITIFTGSDKTNK